MTYTPRWLAWALVAAAAAAAGAAEPARRPLPAACTVVSIDAIGAATLARIQEQPGLTLWVEADDQLLACGGASALDEVRRLAPPLRREGRLDPRRLRLATGFARADIDGAGARVVLAGGHHLLVELGSTSREPRLAPSGWRQSLERLDGSAVVLARQAANLPRRRSAGAEASDLLAEVDPQRWYADVVELARFNRYTFSPELQDARDYIAARLGELPGVAVATSPFQVGGVTVRNVIGTLRGASRPEDLIIVGGHYDATSEIPSTEAPGAEDNASGCAGVIEIARLLSARPPAASVLFICYAGEEQGLYGSYDHAIDLVTAGDADRVQAVINLDMIGFTADDDLDCLLDGGGTTALVETLLAAAQHTRLRMVVSARRLGSDHLPYLQNGIPAVLAIENDYAQYVDYHRTTDLPENLSLEMGGEVLRMVAAALVELAGVPSGFGVDQGDGRRELAPSTP